MHAERDSTGDLLCVSKFTGMLGRDVGCVDKHRS